MAAPLQILFSRWSRSAAYPAFAWICILVLPIALNLLAGLSDEFRSSLGEYYGVFSLFLMFQFALGFCTLFLSTMLVTSVSRSELVDQMRLTFVSPRELLDSLLRQLGMMLGPPALVFIVLAFGWMILSLGQGAVMRMLSINGAVTFIFLLGLAQLGSILLICLGIERNVFWFVLAALPFQFLLTGGAIFLLVSRMLEPWLLVLLSLACIMALYLSAMHNLNRLWPPRKAGRAV